MISKDKYNEYMRNNKFNAEAYAECDGVSKTAIMNFLLKKGCTDVRENGQFDVDISFTSKKNIKYDADIEVRTNWDKEYFPFLTIHIPFRKEKFVLGTNNFMYFVVNKSITRCLLCTKQDIVCSKIVTIKTPRMEEEYFYDVPIGCFTLHKL